jgi:penicillin-binding protein 2
MTRYYPHGELFAHVIGYVGRINDKELKSIDKDLYAGTNLIGKIGVEKSYEDLFMEHPVMNLLKQMHIVMYCVI